MDQLAHLLPIISAHASQLTQSGVVAIRPGYTRSNGWPTKEPAIVVIRSQHAHSLDLPKEIEGVVVDVREATELEELRFKQPLEIAQIAEHRAELRDDAFPTIHLAATGDRQESPIGLEAVAKPQLAYTQPTGVSLQPVSGKIAITCHASPDAGWPTLKTFLSATAKSLTAGIYDFTSKHILTEVAEALSGKKKLELTLDNPARNPTADQTDKQTVTTLKTKLSADFKSAWALVRSNSDVPEWIFPTAYHIKVAVRDSNSFWLSSGNWNNSNQPDFDPIDKPDASDQKTAKASDRDWHVIVEHAGLAATYEAFLKHDFEVASKAEAKHKAAPQVAKDLSVPESLLSVAKDAFEFHRPLAIEEEMTITPLLTPDQGVYQPAMLKLVNSAKKKLYIQLQYIHPSDKPADKEFTALIDAVAARSKAAVDVRIIVSQWQASGGWLERLQAAGIDLKSVKIQNGVHNKGFVIDSKVVALGSQNWSAEGVLKNRDASLIIENDTAAKYFERIFLHDWERIAKQSV